VKRLQTRETAKITMKKKKSSLAISADPEAIPPNPKIAAMMAMMKNAKDQRSMTDPPNVGFRNGDIYDVVSPSVLEMFEPPDASGQTGSEGRSKV
jgi:hypothetical protein